MGWETRKGRKYYYESSWQAKTGLCEPHRRYSRTLQPLSVFGLGNRLKGSIGSGQPKFQYLKLYNRTLSG